MSDNVVVIEEVLLCIACDVWRKENYDDIQQGSSENIDYRRNFHKLSFSHYPLVILSFNYFDIMPFNYFVI